MQAMLPVDAPAWMKEMAGSMNEMEAQVAAVNAQNSELKQQVGWGVMLAAKIESYLAARSYVFIPSVLPC